MVSLFGFTDRQIGSNVNLSASRELLEALGALGPSHTIFENIPRKTHGSAQVEESCAPIRPTLPFLFIIKSDSHPLSRLLILTLGIYNT